MGTHFLRSLYMSCSSFFQRADMRRKLSLPHGSPAAIRCTSMVDFPSAYAWSYWGSPLFDVLKANRSSSTSHSLVTCSMTFLVRFTWATPKSLLFHHFYTHNHLWEVKKALKIFKLHPKRKGFFSYETYAGNLEGWRREGGGWTSFFIKSNEFEGMLLFSSHGRLPFERMRAASVSDDVITSYNFAWNPTTPTDRHNKFPIIEVCVCLFPPSLEDLQFAVNGKVDNTF